MIQISISLLSILSAFNIFNLNQTVKKSISDFSNRIDEYTRDTKVVVIILFLICVLYEYEFLQLGNLPYFFLYLVHGGPFF